MPAPARSKPLRKDNFARTFSTQKPILFSETSRPSSIPPHIRHLSWSPTGLALSTTTGSKIRIWNPDRPNVKSSQELAGHAGSVERVEWNPTREGELASTGQDGSVRLWDVRVGPGAVGQAGRSSCVKDVKVGDAGLFLAWHPGGTQMVVGRRDDVLVTVDVRKGVMGEISEDVVVQEKGKLGSGQTNQCAFSHSGRELFATTSEGTVKVLDWPSMVRYHTMLFSLSTEHRTEVLTSAVSSSYPPGPHERGLQSPTLTEWLFPRRWRWRLPHHTLGHPRLGLQAHAIGHDRRRALCFILL